jgi:hypothetical protein
MACAAGIPKLRGRLGSCHPRGPAWLSLHLPACGSPPLPVSTRAWYCYNAAEGEGFFGWAWREGGDLAPDPLGALVDLTGFNFPSISHFPYHNSNLEDMHSIGDPRGELRYLKVVVELTTDPVFDGNSGEATPWADYPPLPDFGTTTPRRFRWVYQWSALDPRIQSITGHGNMFPGFDPDTGEGGVFYTKTLQSDGTYLEMGTTGPGGIPSSEFGRIAYIAVPYNMPEACVLLGEVPREGWSGTTNVWSDGTSYQYTGLGITPGGTFHTTFKMTKSAPCGYLRNTPPWEQPGTPDFPEHLITMGDRLLAQYDPANFTKSHPFNTYPTGEAVTVTFKPWHCYHIFPFFLPVEGEDEVVRLGTEMVWACVEPDYTYGTLPESYTGVFDDRDYCAGLTPPAAGIQVEYDHLALHDGIRFFANHYIHVLDPYWPELGPYEPYSERYDGVEPCATDPFSGCAYEIFFDNLEVDIPWWKSRDLVRSCCIRRCPGLGANTELDTLFSTGIFESGKIAGFTDWLEIGKASWDPQTSQDACLLLYPQTRGAVRNTSIAGPDNGHWPSLPDAPGSCVQNYRSRRFDRTALGAPVDYGYPPMGVAVLLRGNQPPVHAGGSIVVGYIAGLHGGPLGSYWFPDCCQDEVGLESKVEGVGGETVVGAGGEDVSPAAYKPAAPGLTGAGGEAVSGAGGEQIKPADQ